MVGTSGKPVTFSSLHAVEDRLREGERLFQHQRRADLHRHQHLIEAVVERDRQHVEDDVVGRVLEIGGDRGRGGDDVLMRHHHALREAGRAGGVDQHREVEVDARRRGRAAAVRSASSKRACRRAAPASPPSATIVSSTTAHSTDRLGAHRQERACVMIAAGAAIVERCRRACRPWSTD